MNKISKDVDSAVEKYLIRRENKPSYGLIDKAKRFLTLAEPHGISLMDMAFADGGNHLWLRWTGQNRSLVAAVLLFDKGEIYFIGLDHKSKRCEFDLEIDHLPDFVIQGILDVGELGQNIHEIQDIHRTTIEGLIPTIIKARPRWWPRLLAT